jgi:CheY-like chemotaxis protein
MSVTILVASGDSKRLRRLTSLVESEGAKSVAADSASEALRLFHLRSPDLTVLYVDPEDDISLELCRDMRTLRAAKKRAILVVATKESRRQAFEAGCDAFVPRQTDTAPLDHALRRFLMDAQRQAKAVA